MQIELDNGETLSVDAYPLPDGIEDTVLNRSLLAQAMAVSEPTISKWVSAGMPVLSRGGNGTSYEFQLSHCYAWRMWQKECNDRARRRAADVAQQMAMTFLNDAEADEISMTPQDVRAWAEAELVRARAEEQRGDLVRRHRVERLLQSMISITRDALVGYGDFLEAELGLAPREVEIAQTRADQLLTELRLEIERHLDGVSAEVTPIRPNATETEAV